MRQVAMGLTRIRQLLQDVLAGVALSLLGLLGLANAVTAHPIDTLQSGQWYRVPNSKLTSVAASNVPGSFGSIMGAWSGGAFDTTRNRLIIWGGGHGDYAGNEIYAFDVASLTWVRLTNPSTDVGGDVNSGYYPDGNPRAFHTYEYIEYVPSIDRFCSFGNSAGYPGVNSTSNIDCFNFETLQWEPRRGNLPSGAWGTPATAAAYDPTTGHVFVLGMLGSSILAEFNPTTNASSVRSSPDYTSYYVTADIDPTRRKFVAVGSGQQFSWNITGSGQVSRTALSTTGATEIAGKQAPGLVYDPISDRMVAWSGGADVYTLNLDTLTWTRHAPAATNTVVPSAAAGNGTYGRFRYMPAYNAFIVVNSVSDDVYIYKLTAGAGQPLPPSAPPPTLDTASPSVSLSSPSTGGTVSGVSVSISATASDNVGVSSVQFMLDGQNLGSPDTAAPYSIVWNTTQVGNGTHTLAAVARDAAGNQTTASSVTVTVSNQATSTPPLSSGSSVLLVDFGGTSTGSTFGPLGWTTIFLDRYTDYRAVGPGGTAIVIGDNEAYNYQGVSGPPRSFAAGEKIVVTWYNNSAATVGFAPKVSFDDPNRPVVVTGMPEQGTWYNMSTVSIPAFGTAVSEFSFTTASAGIYALVNINSNFANAGTVICDRIELAGASTGGLPPSVPPAPAADTVPPTIPTGVSAGALSTSDILLTWNAATDNVGVVGYKVFRNGTQITTTATNSYTNTGLTTGTSYSFSVAAYDAAGNISAQTNAVTQSTQSLPPTPPPPATPPVSSPPTSGGGGGPVSVPLTIHELLPVGTTGMARTNEPATFGIALKDSDGVQTVGSLGLSGASTYQFKPLSYHPSGNLKWVLVDTIGSVSAGGTAQMTLTTGSGNSAGTNLAVDNGSVITVNTGPSQFTIRKSGFNIIDSVMTNGTTLVTSGHSGGLQFTDGTGAMYTSANDNPTVTVLENGPVKSVIKAEGRFKSTGGSNAPMGYTIYLTFYTGQTSVKVGATLRNAYQAVYARVKFQSFELRLPTALGGTKSFTFATSKGNYSGTVTGTENAYLFQGYTKNKRGPDDYRWPDNYLDIPVNRAVSGVKVVKDATVLKDFVGDDTADYALGWGETRSASNQGVTVSYKDMDAYFPSAIEFAGDGTVTVGLFSKRNPKGALVFDWATHESRELLLDFHSSAADNALINARLQMPLFGRAPFEQYRDAGAFMGETRIGSYAEQQAIYQTNGYKAPSTGAPLSISNQPRQVYRIWDHSQGGAENQRDYMLANQIDYVRLGYGGQLLNSLQRAMFEADQFARHSDDFDFRSKPNDYFDHVDVSAGLPVNGNLYNHHEDDFEHLWVYGLYTSYYLTGDERFLIGANEASESLYNRYGSSSDKNVFDRLGISAAREAVLSYMSTRDQQYLDKVNRYMVYFLNTALQYPNAPLHGRSLTRGYLISLYEEATQVMYSMIGNTYFPPSIMDVLRHTPANHVFSSSTYPGLAYTKEDLEDVLEGLAYFFIKEAYNYPATGRPNVAYGYNTLLGSANPGLRVYDSGLLAAWGFERTGDTQFLSLGARLAVNVDEDQTVIANSEIGLLRLMYDIQHQSEMKVGLIPLQVSNPSAGTYTLSWTVPTDAKRYQIKFSAKPIVANLNYNKGTGTFEFDPSQYTAFWAATNLTNEPTPAAPGTTQTFTVSGLSCGNACRFAIRSYGDTSTASPVSPPTSDSTPPSVPANVQATGVSTSQITLTWQAALDNVGVSGYRIYENGTFIAQSTGTSYTHSGLVPGATYIYSVAASDGAGNLSGRSTSINVTTSGAPPSPAPLPAADTSAPSIPGGLTATVASQTQINLAWGASTDNVGVVGYRIYRNGTQIGTSAGTAYAASGLTAGTSYSFTVLAYDAAGNTSGQSVAAAATTQSALDTTAPSVPGNLVAAATSQAQVNLTWSPSTDNVAVVGYKLYRSGSQIAVTSATAYSQTGLTAGTTYSYTVAAYDAAGNTSVSSAVATATTLSPTPPPVPDPTPAPSTGRVIELSPSNADTSCNEEFENIASTLRAGDTLILHGGTYSQTCARVLSNLHGTAQQPILIRAATGESPVITRPVRPNGDYDQNNVEIADSSYLTLRGLIFTGGDLGVRLRGTNHHITIEDSEIAETGDAALTANSGDTDVLIVRHSHIHHTGLYTLGSTEGEGLYLGCNNGTCRVTNSVIEFNYIHDLRGTSSGGNDGIEVKVGSGGNLIRHNVIHTTTLGTAYPCILVYGGGAASNTVEGNAVWQCGEGIVALSDAVVQNNVVLQSNSGLASYPHEQVAALRNVLFVNNTVYGNTECASLRWAGASNMVLANNALYCGGAMAVYTTGLTGPTVLVRANYIDGTIVGASVDGTRFLLGGTAAGTFVSPGTRDFWPVTGSPLRNTAEASNLPLTDFNGLPRTTYQDVGAYSTKGLAQNMGWRIVPGFKTLSADSTAPTRPQGLRLR